MSGRVLSEDASLVSIAPASIHPLHRSNGNLLRHLAQLCPQTPIRGSVR